MMKQLLYWWWFYCHSLTFLWLAVVWLRGCLLTPLLAIGVSRQLPLLARFIQLLVLAARSVGLQRHSRITGVLTIKSSVGFDARSPPSLTAPTYCLTLLARFRYCPPDWCFIVHCCPMGMHTSTDCRFRISAGPAEPVTVGLHRGPSKTLACSLDDR